MLNHNAEPATVDVQPTTYRHLLKGGQTVSGQLTLAGYDVALLVE